MARHITCDHCGAHMSATPARGEYLKNEPYKVFQMVGKHLLINQSPVGNCMMEVKITVTRTTEHDICDDCIDKSIQEAISPRIKE